MLEALAGAALLFALQPLQANAVVWVAASHWIDATGFAVLSMALLLAHRREGKRGLYWASVVAMALALLSNEWVVAAGLGAGILALLALRSRRRLGRKSSLAFFGALWMVLSQAPLRFESIVPATARYWYASSVGLALMVTGVYGAIAARARFQSRFAVGLGAAALVAFWLPALRTNVLRYADAGSLARAIQQQLLQVARGLPEHAPIFVANNPAFLESSEGVAVAQVFHWGLRDAVSPPFVSAATRARVYALPAGDVGLMPVLSSPYASGLRSFAQASARLEPMVGASSEETARLDVTRPRDGAAFPPHPEAWRGVVCDPPPGRYFVYVAGPGNASRWPTRLEPDDG